MPIRFFQPTVEPLAAKIPSRRGGFVRWLARFVMRLGGWRVINPLPNLDKFVFIGAPHTTNWDGFWGLTALLALDIDAKVMIKDSAFKGWRNLPLRWLGGIPINRKAAGGVVEQSILQFKQRDAFVLLLAPEGTRHGADEWKQGFHRIALGAGVPIVCASCHYRRKEFLIGPTIYPTADFAADLDRMLTFYAETSGAEHPERISKPLAAKIASLQSRSGSSS